MSALGEDYDQALADLGAARSSIVGAFGALDREWKRQGSSEDFEGELDEARNHVSQAIAILVEAGENTRRFLMHKAEQS